MNFSRILFFVFACFLVFSTVSANPKWKIFKKLEKVGRNVRDGVIKAGPAIQVIGEAKAIGK